ncbi:hypothetical protein ACR90Y_25960 [Klebsiella pneumoniae]
MANFNPSPRTAIAAVRDSKNDIETWKKNGIRREEIVTVLNEREASGPDNGFFLSGNDFMRAEEESQRVVESFRDSLSRKKGF